MALASASVFLGVLVSEAAVRVSGLAPAVSRIETDVPTSPFRRTSDPLLGYELKASFRHPDGDGIETNSRGLRDRERAVPKPAGTRRVALLGDSVVMGLFLASNGDTIPAQLERQLAPQGVEVLGFGVKGYCTQAEVRVFEKRGLDLGVDLALVVFVRDDHVNRNRDASRYFVRRRPAWAASVFHVSHLFRLLALRLDLWGIRADLDPAYARARNEAAFDRDNVDAGLRRLADLAAQRGFRAAVLVWPSFERRPVDPDNLFEAGPGGSLRVEATAARHGIPVVRLSDRFRADLARRREGGERGDARRVYTFDGMHPNRTGAAAAAAIIHELLREHPEWLGAPRIT